MLIGDTGTGTAYLLSQFAHDKVFCSNFVTTIGIGFQYRIMYIGDEVIKAQLWNTGNKLHYMEPHTH